MTERPVFLPTERGPRLYQEMSVSFAWAPGMAPSQKKKNVLSLHEAAAKVGLAPLLEISSKSEREVGRRLSAFSLQTIVGERLTTIECAYQGSKVFENGGPFTDLYFASSREARGDERLRNSGRLVGFRFEGKDYPLSPTTAFYDWLYLCALYPHRHWLLRLHKCAGFTDIEYNPQKSLNCQARSCAIFISLQKRNLLEESLGSFQIFADRLRASDG